MVGHLFPFLQPVPQSIKRQLLRLRWRSIDVVGDITLPMLFLSADQAPLPRSNSRFINI